MEIVDFRGRGWPRSALVGRAFNMHFECMFLEWGRRRAVQDQLRLMEAGLERAAESIGDITAPVMARFYARFPAARAAFEHHGSGNREALEAQMVENALLAAMTWLERPAEVRILLGCSVPHHQDTLAVPPGWYRGLMDATIDVIAGSIPPGAQAELELWNGIRRSLAEEIAAA